MSAPDLLTRLLAEFGARTSESLALGPDGACALWRPDGIELHIEADEEAPDLRFWSPVRDLAGLARLKRARLLEHCLGLNLFTLETCGATLGWDEAEARILLLYRAEAATLDGTIFANLVGNLLDVAADLRSRLTELSSAAPSIPPRPSWTELRA